MTSSSLIIKPPPPSEWRRLVEFGIAKGWLRPYTVDETATINARVNPSWSRSRMAVVINPAITVVTQCVAKKEGDISP